jgi:hypothetical protein
MNGFVTLQRLARVAHLPISFPQTAVAAGDSLLVASFAVAQGQRLEIRALTLNVVGLLTPGVIPDFAFPTYQSCSVGLYRNSSNCSPLAFASVEGTGVASFNIFRNIVIITPDEYNILVQNNMTNVDLSVAVTGAVKLYF